MFTLLLPDNAQEELIAPVNHKCATSSIATPSEQQLLMCR